MDTIRLIVKQRPAAKVPRRPAPASPIRANFAYLAVGNSVYGVCQWLIVAVLARFDGPRALGSYSFALAVAAPLVLLANLQLANVQATDALDEYTFQEYLGLRIVTTIVAFVSLLLFGVLGRNGWTTGSVVVLVSGAKCLDAISDVLFGRMFRRERMRLVAWGVSLNGLASAGLVGITLILFRSVVLAASASLAGSAISLLLVNMPNAMGREWSWRPVIIRPSFERLRLCALAKVSAPLGVVMALISLTVNVPIYVVHYRLGTEQVGIFGAFTYLLLMPVTLVTSLGQSVAPRLAKYYRTDDRRGYVRLLVRLCAASGLIGLSIFIAAFFFGPAVLHGLYGKDYAAAHRVFLVLVASTAISLVASCFGFGMTSARCFAVQVPLFAMVFLLTAVLSVAFGGRGLEGIAWAVLGGATVQLSLSAAVVTWAVRNQPARTSRAWND